MHEVVGSVPAHCWIVMSWSQTLVKPDNQCLRSHLHFCRGQSARWWCGQSNAINGTLPHLLAGGHRVHPSIFGRILAVNMVIGSMSRPLYHE